MRERDRERKEIRKKERKKGKKKDRVKSELVGVCLCERMSVRISVCGGDKDKGGVKIR